MKKWIAYLLVKTKLFAFAGDIRKRLEYLSNRQIRSRNAAFKKTGAPDGLPLPPPFLAYKVTSGFSLESFYRLGVLGSQCIQEILKNNGIHIQSFHKILDFGCGCGRVIRHWKSLPHSKVFGTDYNPELVQWCKKNLAFADFQVNHLSLRLTYDDNNFDFIYAISVFTHLTEPLQQFWIKELARVLKPGGYLYITIHGKSFVSLLPVEQKKQFEAGRLVTTYSMFAGTNLCGVYHPEEYVRNVLAKDLDILDFIPGGAKDVNQDAILLRKPPTT